jgi:hypothetical protein
MDWQSFSAAACVIITLMIFAYRVFRPRKKQGCGHGCDCKKTLSR